MAKRILLFAIAGIGLWMVVNLDIFSAAVKKLYEVLGGGSTVDSRIRCGFDVINSMDFWGWLLGTSYNDVAAYVRQYGSRIPMESPVHVYMAAKGSVFLNTFTQIIFQYGLVGLLLYLGAIYSRLTKKKYEAKMYLIMMLVSILGQGKFLNSIFFMELIFLFLYDRKERMV